MTGPVRHDLMAAIDRDIWSSKMDTLGAEWDFDADDDNPFVHGSSPLIVDEDIADRRRWQTRTRHWGLVLQDQLSWGRATARLAVRRGEIRETEEGEFLSDAPANNTWDAGLAYRWTPDATFYVGGQHTYEVDSRFVLADWRDTAVPLLTVRQRHLGAKFALQDKRALLGVEAYELHQRDHIAENGITQIPGRRTRGLEIEYTGRVSRSLELSLGLEFNHSRDTRAEFRPYTVSSTGIAGRSLRVLANYRLPPRWLANTSLGFAFLGYGNRWISPVDDTGEGSTDGPLRVPGGASMDLSVTREFDAFSLTETVSNVADRRGYGTYGTHEFIPLLPERAYSLALRTSF